MDFHLFGMTFGTLPCAPRGAYPVTYDNTASYAGAPAMQSVFLVAAILTIAAIVCGVGMLVLSVLEDARPRLRGVGLPLGVMATIFAFAAPILTTAWLPGAINQDSGFSSPFTGFWGSAPYPGGASATMAWGAGLGWYLIMAAGVVFLVGSVLVFRQQGQSAGPPRRPTPGPQ